MVEQFFPEKPCFSRVAYKQLWNDFFSIPQLLVSNCGIFCSTVAYKQLWNDFFFLPQLLTSNCGVIFSTVAYKQLWNDFFFLPQLLTSNCGNNGFCWKKSLHHRSSTNYCVFFPFSFCAKQHQQRNRHQDHFDAAISSKDL